jgi:hypothetical protein
MHEFFLRKFTKSRAQALRGSHALILPRPRIQYPDTKFSSSTGILSTHTPLRAKFRRYCVLAHSNGRRGEVNLVGTVFLLNSPENKCNLCSEKPQLYLIFPIDYRCRVKRTHFPLRTFSEKTFENSPSRYNLTLQDCCSDFAAFFDLPNLLTCQIGLIICICFRWIHA